MKTFKILMLATGIVSSLGGIVTLSANYSDQVEEQRRMTPEQRMIKFAKGALFYKNEKTGLCYEYHESDLHYWLPVVGQHEVISCEAATRTGRLIVIR